MKKDMQQKENLKKLQIVNTCSLFDGIDLSEVTLIYKRFHRREEISDEVDGISCIGIIGAGEADVYTTSDELSQPNVSTQYAGSVFGICNVYIPDAMPTKLICKVQCDVVFISKDDFRHLIEKNTILQERYLTLCNRKIMYLAQKIELMGISNTKCKLACFLLRNADETGAVTLETSKEQFAKYLSISRASLFRTIADFTNKNLIISTDTGFQIIDKSGLTAVRQGE